MDGAAIGEAVGGGPSVGDIRTVEEVVHVELQVYLTHAGLAEGISGREVAHEIGIDRFGLIGGVVQKLLAHILAQQVQIECFARLPGKTHSADNIWRIGDICRAVIF